jgi:sphingolipid delta-4 desaturase
MYRRSDLPAGHRSRGRAILAKHPEVRALTGPNRWTAVIAVALVGAQLAAAALIDALAWWWALALAFLFGAHVVHALYAVLHETAHKLVFRSRAANRCLTLLCNVPLVAPFAVALCHYHLVHHRALGELGRDPDVPAPWEVSCFGRSPAGKLAFAALFPLVQPFRPTAERDAISYRDGWLVANVVVQLVVSALIAWLLGVNALLYLLASVYFWAGPHPLLFGRFVQEHFVTDGDGHETHSYYGALNHVTLNIGYHVEHHDLPAIPWNRLPALRRIASSFYADRTSHYSWLRLGARYLFDERIGVGSRVVRAPRELQAAGAESAFAARQGS